MHKHGHGCFVVLFLMADTDKPSSESCPHWQKDVAPPLYPTRRVLSSAGRAEAAKLSIRWSSPESRFGGRWRLTMVRGAPRESALHTSVQLSVRATRGSVNVAKCSPACTKTATSTALHPPPPYRPPTARPLSRRTMIGG